MKQLTKHLIEIGLRLLALALLFAVVVLGMRACASACRARGGTAIMDYVGGKVVCMEPPR